MATYYLCVPYGVPHLFDPLDPDMTKCGQSMAGAQSVSELQVLVWLDHRVCVDCAPTVRTPGGAHGKKKREAS